MESKLIETTPEGGAQEKSLDLTNYDNILDQVFADPSEYYSTFYRILNELCSSAQEINPDDPTFIHIKNSLSKGTNPLKSLREKFKGEWIFNPKAKDIQRASKIYIESKEEFVLRCEDIIEGEETNLKLPTNKPWVFVYIPEVTDIDTPAFANARKIN